MEREKRMGSHSILSPSKAERRIFCPGSMQREAKYPDVLTEWSLEGKLAHDYCYHILGCTDEIINVDINMQRYCETYITYVRNIEAQWAVFEQEFYMYRVHPKMFGTPDAVIIDQDNTYHIVDFKYGFAPVEVKENWQLLSYAMGVDEFFPVVNIKKFTLTIVQPRAFHKDGIIRSWSFTSDELDKYREVLKNNSELCMSENPPLSAGLHCMYCKAKTECKVFSKKVISMTKEKKDFDSKSHELQYLKTFKKMLDTRLDDITAELISRLKDGQEVPIYKLKTLQSRRKWVIDDVDILNIGEINGIDLTAAVTPTEAERRGLDRGVIEDITSREDLGFRLEEA